MRNRFISVLVVFLTTGLITCRAADRQDKLATAIARETACMETIMDRKVHIEPKIIDEVPHVPRWCSLLDVDPHHIHIGDCELYCELEGEGIPLVLLHGGPGATHHCFHPKFSSAAKFAKVVYYDQRGCGVSDWIASEGYTLDQAVNDLDRLRERLGFERWVVLGHSFGGLVAQCYALEHPEHVAGLVLVSSSLGFGADTGPSRQAEFLTDDERARIAEIHSHGGRPSAVRVYNAFLNGDWKRQQYCKPTATQCARIALYEWKHDKHFRDALNGETHWLNLRGGFDGCPIPTLIVEGKWDLTWGTDKPKILHGNHPNARLVILERAGHSPFVSNPEEFFRVLGDFVETLPAGPVPKLAAWKKHVVDWRDKTLPTSMRVITSVGWGHRSSVKIAEAYTPEWLDALQDPSLLLRTAFALYDVGRYEEALSAFRRLSQVAAERPLYQGVALVWQGHMLDLLDRRAEAVAAYQEAVELNIEDRMQHSQYRMTYSPSKYAAERIKKPFTRVPNQEERE